MRAVSRRPHSLAELAKGKRRPKIPQLTAALHGHFGAHHAIAAARLYGKAEEEPILGCIGDDDNAAGRRPGADPRRQSYGTCPDVQGR
jgi:hypothetical protein